ncbi:hypothetical protein Rt10032_c12g4726 [Rhodotorula toruloides]|uniref:Proteophosphoglycan ppg4 n=1 Tax=Rhodotorula toruloides TaxID=5286 RepID=A0A511KK14_RHOTO|nr:hypothetical protein Rt10032_c12g4726 [Rhodotorula toruloides]
MILKDVYAHTVPLAPPCRALLPLHDKLLQRRYAKVKVAGSDMLQRYSSTIQTRSAVGLACLSLKVSSNYRFPHKKLSDIALSSFFVPLANLRKLDIDNAQLTSAFVEHVEKSPASPFPHLGSMTFALECPTEPAKDQDETEMVAFPKLVFISLAIRAGDLSSIIQITASASTLRTLDAQHFAADATYGALLEAAAKLGTVTKLTLSGAASMSWKTPKQLKSFTILTDLTLGTGCTARDAPTFKFLRRLPLQSLHFGSGTVVLSDHVLSLITGIEKLNSLRTITLDNIHARCDDVQQWDWRRDIDALYHWQQEGYTKPRWTKTFSRQGCQKLIDAAESQGITLAGSSVEANDIEDEISTNKNDVEGFLERQRRRDGREWRERGFRW